MFRQFLQPRFVRSDEGRMSEGRTDRRGITHVTLKWCPQCLHAVRVDRPNHACYCPECGRWWRLPVKPRPYLRYECLSYPGWQDRANAAYVDGAVEFAEKYPNGWADYWAEREGVWRRK